MPRKTGSPLWISASLDNYTLGFRIHRSPSAMLDPPRRAGKKYCEKRRLERTEITLNRQVGRHKGWNRTGPKQAHPLQSSAKRRPPKISIEDYGAAALLGGPMLSKG